jgi:ribonuclease HII
MAKVTRDKLMDDYDIVYPQYGFAKHKGYPTLAHKENIKTFGLTPIHRKTFKYWA